MTNLKILIVAGVMGLAACSSTPNPASTSAGKITVFEVESAYGVAQRLAIAYVSRPRCAPGVPPTVTNICSDQLVVNKIAAADPVARRKLKEAEDFVRYNPTLDATDAIKAAKAALDLLRQIEANANIK